MGHHQMLLRLKRKSKAHHRYDREPSVGKLQTFPTLFDAFATARAVHPGASMEGSTGPERSFWVAGECVGYAWPCTLQWTAYHARIRATE